MASPQFFVLGPVILCLLVFSFFTTTSSSKVAAAPPDSSSSSVSLTVYYESYNLPSAKFLSYNLSTIWERQLDFVDIKLVPYGKSHRLENGTTICENGLNGCEYNKLEACVMSVLPVDQHGILYLEFIICIENLFIADFNNPDYEDTCFGTDLLRLVDGCMDSELGNHLELLYLNETAAVSPPIESVPWLTVNNLPIHDNENFVKEICKAYGGGKSGIPIPRGCRFG